MFSDERTDDSPADLPAQARAGRDAPRGAAAARPDDAVRDRLGARRAPEDAAPYFRDVADHLARVAETIDNLDNLLSTAFDAHLAQISIRQNDDMRRISASVGLVAAPTLVGSIYGMNFVHMPELHWAFGYPMALMLMALSSLAVWVIARRAGWL